MNKFEVMEGRFKGVNQWQNKKACISKETENHMK